MTEINIQNIRAYLLDLQNRLCHLLEQEDGEAKFTTDAWQRPAGGGGITQALEGGSIIEKTGVNFSEITGETLPPSASLQRPEIAGRSFHALGVSSITHPRNPFAPTAHLNVRFFAATKPGEKTVWWFGGGFDLTPYYGFIEDCQHFHQMAAAACAPFGKTVYPRFKKLADEYFYLKHRQEPRGIGGIFFDDLNEWDFATCFAFMQSVGDHYLKAYIPLIQRRKNTPYQQKHREFQCYRRGRYVEFNLIYDRGTLFGLQSGGRTESILISLPSEVRWHYNWQPEKNSEEARLYSEFLPPRDWL